MNNDKVKKKINIVLVTIFCTFQNLTNHLYQKFEGDYYGFYFENILCLCDLSTYYPRCTLKNNKVKKKINIVLVTIFEKIQNLTNHFYKDVWRWLFRVDFVNILCEWDFLTYYPRCTLDNNKVKKKINIVLVTIFCTFQNLTNHLYKDVWRWLLRVLFW